MAKLPRRPRAIPRTAAPASDALTSRPLVRRRDPRQVELFVTSFVGPCKLTVRATPPTGPLWQFEIKQDGYHAPSSLWAEVDRAGDILMQCSGGR